MPEVDAVSSFVSKPIKAIILPTGRAVCLYKVGGAGRGQHWRLSRGASCAFGRGAVVPGRECAQCECVLLLQAASGQ